MIDLITSFPTAIFTFLLAVCVLWWLVSMILSGLDSDFEADADPDGFADQLGLTSMPLPLALSVLSLFGWVTSALIHKAVSDNGATNVAVGVGLGIVAAGVVVGLLFVKLASKPLGRLFDTESAPSRSATVGSFCKVRTLTVDDRFGDAEVTSGPTRNSIIQVRAVSGQFQRGDIAHVIDYDDSTNTFRIATVDPEIQPD